MEDKDAAGFYVPEKVWYDTNISWRAKAVYCDIKFSQVCGKPITRAILLEKSKEGREALDSAIKELKKAGYLEIKPSGQKGAWIWILKGN